MRNKTVFDGAIRSDFVYQPHEGKLYRHDTQPERDKILARNAELRKNPGALRDLTFGRQIMSIPEIDMPKLRKEYPELLGDPTKKAAAYAKILLRYPEYGVQPVGGNKIFTGND